MRTIESPWVPSLGRELRFAVHASGGNAAGTRIALPSGTFAPAQGPMVIRLMVPSDPSLRGGRLFAQALVADLAAPARMHLTALVAVRIWR